MPEVKEEPAAEPAEPVTEEPASEPVAVEPVTEEGKEPAAEEVKTEPVTEPAVPELVIDELEGGPAAFMAEVGKDPAAKAFFDSRPEWKNTVNAALRRSADAKKIAEVGIFPANAPIIAKAAATFQTIDNHFLSAANEDGTPNPDGAKAFLHTWAAEARMMGEDGKPILDANGNQTFHPALGHILNQVHSNLLNYDIQQFEATGKLTPQMAEGFQKVLTYLHQKATATGDDRQIAGLEIAQEIVQSLNLPAQGEIPAELKPLADSLKAERAAIDNEKQTAARQQQETRQTQFKTSLETSDSKAADNFLSQAKPKLAGLTEFERDAATAKIGKLIDAKLDANELYQSERASLESQLKRDPSNQKLQIALTKLTIMHGQEELGPIVATVLREAKGGALGRQSAKDTKVAGQVQASAADPRGASITPSSPVTLSPKDLGAQITKEYMDAHGGERPSTEYIIAERMKRTAAAQKKTA